VEHPLLTKTKGKLMKIAVTITDAGMAVNVGGPVESETAIIELRDDQIPRVLRRHLEDRKRVRAAVDSGEKRIPYMYQTLSISFVSED
jgi:hypothetical protein